MNWVRWIRIVGAIPPVIGCADEPRRHDGRATPGEIGLNGGEFDCPNGKLTIVVPPGALSAPTALSCRPRTDVHRALVGSAYELRPEGQKFSNPVTLRFDITTTTAVTPATYVGDRWQPLTRIQTGRGTVSGETLHFSLFGLVESPVGDSGAGDSEPLGRDSEPAGRDAAPTIPRDGATDAPTGPTDARSPLRDSSARDVTTSSEGSTPPIDARPTPEDAHRDAALDAHGATPWPDIPTQDPRCVPTCDNVDACHSTCSRTGSPCPTPTFEYSPGQAFYPILPRLAFANDGSAHMAYVSDGQLFYTRRIAGAWTRARTVGADLPANQTFAHIFNLAVTPDGTEVHFLVEPGSDGPARYHLALLPDREVLEPLEFVFATTMGNRFTLGDAEGVKEWILGIGWRRIGEMPPRPLIAHHRGGMVSDRGTLFFVHAGFDHAFDVVWGDGTGSWGREEAIAPDPALKMREIRAFVVRNGVAHISYREELGGKGHRYQARYARRDERGWAQYTIRAHPIFDMGMNIDTCGAPHFNIVGSGGNVFYTHWSSSKWQTDVLTDPGCLGYVPEFALGGDRMYISFSGCTDQSVRSFPPVIPGEAFPPI